MGVVCEDEGAYPTFPSLIIYQSGQSVSQSVNSICCRRTLATECADPRPELLLKVLGS